MVKSVSFSGCSTIPDISKFEGSVLLSFLSVSYILSLDSAYSTSVGLCSFYNKATNSLRIGLMLICFLSRPPYISPAR